MLLLKIMMMMMMMKVMVIRHAESLVQAVSRHCSAETAKQILEDGTCDVNEGDEQYGRTALHWAVIFDEIDTVKELLKSEDINVNQNDVQFGRPVLHWAVLHNNIDIVKELLKRKDIDVNQIDGQLGRTALHWAAVFGHFDVAKELLNQNGIVVGQRDMNGRLALSLAHYDDMIQLIAQNQIASLLSPMVKLRMARRVEAARRIQQGCHDWVFAPKCKDGTVGIRHRLDMVEMGVTETPLLRLD